MLNADVCSKTWLASRHDEHAYRSFDACLLSDGIHHAISASSATLSPSAKVVAFAALTCSCFSLLFNCNCLFIRRCCRFIIFFHLFYLFRSSCRYPCRHHRHHHRQCTRQQYPSSELPSFLLLTSVLVLAQA